MLLGPTIRVKSVHAQFPNRMKKEGLRLCLPIALLSGTVTKNTFSVNARHLEQKPPSSSLLWDLKIVKVEF